MGSNVAEFMAAEAEKDKLAIVNQKVESTRALSPLALTFTNLVIDLSAISSLISDLGPYIDGEASMEDCQKGATHLKS